MMFHSADLMQAGGSDLTGQISLGAETTVEKVSCHLLSICNSLQHLPVNNLNPVFGSQLLLLHMDICQVEILLVTASHALSCLLMTLLLQVYEPDHLDAEANAPKRSRTITEAEAAEAMQAAALLVPNAADCNHFKAKRE